MSAMNSKVSYSQDENLETFSLVWLDAQVNTTEDNRQAQLKLRQIINYFRTFDDQHQCQEYILSLSAQDRLILIVSGRLGRELVPRIYHLRQLSSIYVYCQNKTENIKWAKEFREVKDVIVQLDDLINQIKADQDNRIKPEEPLSIKIFNDGSQPDKSTTELNGHFVYSLLLIDVLVRMKCNETDKQQLIALCKKNYQDSEHNLRIVDEFEQKYTSDKALWWYTRDIFLYKMLNKALRVQNIDLLFLFRSVIGDIYRQLKKNQCQSSVRVYRGQLISKDELNTFRQSVGKFISTTSFFSTSAKRNQALAFLNRSSVSNDLCRVLFIINADPCVVKSKPFADISSFSALSGESEVLFMIGCIFRLIDIHYDDVKQIWMVRMELCDDNEHDLNKLFNHLKKNYACDRHEVNLHSFGNLLHYMGKYDLAEKIFHRLFVQLPSNDPSLSDLYYSLGMVRKETKKYDFSLFWFQKSLEIRIPTNPSNYIEIGDLYCCIGNVYMEKGDDYQAMKCYTKSIESYNRAHVENDAHMAAVYYGIANICFYQKNYSEALDYYKQSLTIQEKYLPSDHSDMAINLDGIGTIHQQFGEYDLAMSCYYRSLEMRMNSLPHHHPDIAKNYKNIGLLYETMKEWVQALMYYQQAAIIYCHSLSPEHPNVIDINKVIQHISSQLK